MSASEKSLAPLPQRVAILAGGGEIPRSVIQACKDREIEVFVVAFEGQTDPDTVQSSDHIHVALGQVGKVIKTLKKCEISDLVMIGKIKRPSLQDLKPDLTTARFFAKEALHVLGDDGLLKAIRRFLEEEGFTVHGAQAFLPELLAAEGTIGSVEPQELHKRDIVRGIEVLQMTAPLDIGQAVVIQNGHVLGLEGAEGTDALIERCGSLQRKGEGAVLVKLCKAQQDKDMDLPTIGLQTLKNIVQAGFSGVAVHAGNSFIHDIDEIQMCSDRNNVFVIGVNPEKFDTV